MSKPLFSKPSAREGGTKRPVNHWARLAGFIFLLMVAAGFLRVFGLLSLNPVLIAFATSKWVMIYLVIAGFLYGVVNLFAFFCIATVWDKRHIVAWVSALISIAFYWLEQTLFWTSDQRGKAWQFMLALHLAWLIILTLFTRFDIKNKKLPNEDSNPL